MLVAGLVAAACTGTAATSTTSRPAPTTTSPPVVETTTSATATAAPACRDRLGGAERANGVLAVYDLPAGTRRWEAGISLPDVPFQVPFTVAGDRVVVKERDTLWAFDAAACEVRWELPGRQVIAVAGGDGRLAVVDSIALRLLDAATGEQLWSHGIRWEPPEPPARVAFAPGLVVTTTPDRELVVLDAATGDEVARTGFDGFPSAPAVAGDRAYVTHGSTVEARSLADGRRLWAADAGFPINPGLAFDDDGVYAVSAADATVVALDAATGRERWARTVDELRKFEAPPLLDHGEVHLVDTEREFHHLDAADGSTIFVSRRGAARARLEPEPGLLLEQGGGSVTAFTLLERRAWALETGAGADQVSLLRFGEGFAAVLSFDWS